MKWNLDAYKPRPRYRTVRWNPQKRVVEDFAVETDADGIPLVKVRPFTDPVTGYRHWEVSECPFCTLRHLHGGERLGPRVSHCHTAMWPLKGRGRRPEGLDLGAPYILVADFDDVTNNPAAGGAPLDSL